MMVGRIEGQFLARLVRLSGAKRILELGTFTGYSSISMASALPPDGRIITCDVDPDATAIARRYMDESGFGDRIEIRLGPALETIETLEGPFDLVFIDADKPNYKAYYEAVLPLLAENGLLIADNVLWSGRVVEEDGDESTLAIKDFNEHVANDDRVVSVMLTVRDGMTLVQKRLALARNSTLSGWYAAVERIRADHRPDVEDARRAGELGGSDLQGSADRVDAVRPARDARLEDVHRRRGRLLADVDPVVSPAPLADTVVLASVWVPLYARIPIAMAPPDAVIVELCDPVRATGRREEAGVEPCGIGSAERRVETVMTLLKLARPNDWPPPDADAVT